MTRRRPTTVLVSAVTLGLLACATSSSAPPPTAPLDAAPTSLDTAPTSLDASLSPDAAPTAENDGDFAPIVDPILPPPIACKTIDDCWVETSHGFSTPGRRPKRLRGVRFRPCKGASETPDCDKGQCVVRIWKC